MFDIGMDISSLEETENLGGKFFVNGEEGDLIDILSKNGINTARLRLWVNPYSEKGEPYGAGGCDLATVTRLAKRAIAKGMRILLDLHYSDFWCDPARQCMPKDWVNIDFNALCQQVYDYTCEILNSLKSDGVEPYMVQVGNEITNGMLWPMGKLTMSSEGMIHRGYDSLSRLINSGCKAVRDVSDAKIMMHLERSHDNKVWREWFDEIIKRGADFDVIGASYYPFWHGGFEDLRTNLNDIIARYGKDIMVVETAYAFTTKHYDAVNNGISLVVNESLKCADGSEPRFPLTQEGRRDFIQELFSLVKNLDKGRGNGVYYWEPGWLPVKGSTWATHEAREYMNETHKPGGNEWANQCIFDYEGNANIALDVFRKFAKKE